MMSVVMWVVVDSISPDGTADSSTQCRRRRQVTGRRPCAVALSAAVAGGRTPLFRMARAPSAISAINSR